METRCEMAGTGDSVQEYNPDCPCTWPGCERHGKCRECREYHHGLGQKTACERNAAQ